MARRPGTALPSMFVGNKPAVARPTLAAAVLALSDICRNWSCKQRCEMAVKGVSAPKIARQDLFTLLGRVLEVMNV